MKLQRVPAHRTSTAHVQAAYPFVASDGLGGDGVYIGKEVLGGSFCFDPWVLYSRGLLTNPNMLVAGQVGKRKSTLIKTFLWRQQVFGRGAFIVDPKGEYGPLARACGCEPIRIGPGLSTRLNPLDAGRSGLGGVEGTRERVRLLTSLAAASLRRPLDPVETTACEIAVRAAEGQGHDLTLPHVVEALLYPASDAAAEIAVDVRDLMTASRNVALELRRLSRGDLAGMFDGPTSADIDMDANVVVLDLSAVYLSDAMPLVMLCATAWLQASLSRRIEQRIVVVDEAWAVLRNLQTARWLQSSFKLSRQFGVANVAVVHRLSDLQATGASGSEQSELAKGLLADAETRVVYAQSTSEMTRGRDLLTLTDVEAELLPRLGPGVALWKVGTRSFLVEHRLGEQERAIVDTDARMSI